MIGYCFTHLPGCQADASCKCHAPVPMVVTTANSLFGSYVVVRPAFEWQWHEVWSVEVPSRRQMRRRRRKDRITKKRGRK